MTAPRVHSCLIFRFHRKAVLGCVAVAFAAGLSTATARSQADISQTKSPQEAKPPAGPGFDVASIHQHIPEPHEHNSIWSSPSDSHFRTQNVSLIGLIRWAFDIPETRILNAPGWAATTYFNIEASSDPSMDQQLAHMSSHEGGTQKEAMVRAMLAERFKLATHFETQELPVYQLVAAKGTPKLGEAKLEGTTVNHGRDHLEVQGGDSLALLAEELSKEVGRPVVDKTGIAGRYNLRIRWTPDGMTASTSVDAPPSIFTALEEQLGLKLKSAKGPVQVLVVDHAEMPSGN
jgi:uncharacterized protein (TIGR03435 family)